MESKRKRGRPPLPESEKTQNYTESFYAPIECGKGLEALVASGIYGTTKGAVICALVAQAVKAHNITIPTD